MKNKWIILMLMMLANCWQAEAQTDPIYLREIGGGIGITNYLGDFNGSLTKNMQPAISLVYRKNFSPWHGLRVDAQMSKLKGSSSDSKEYIHDYKDEKYDFSRTLYDLNIVYEYNFWPYGTGLDYRGAQPVTPYIFIGLGATMATGNGTAFTGNLPIGLGVKYKVSERVNLSLDWAMHFSASDKLDNVVDPKYVKSSGIFKNTDCYSSLKVALTYSFSAKCPTCNKYE